LCTFRLPWGAQPSTSASLSRSSPFGAHGPQLCLLGFPPPVRRPTIAPRGRSGRRVPLWGRGGPWRRSWAQWGVVGDQVPDGAPIRARHVRSRSTPPIVRADGRFDRPLFPNSKRSHGEAEDEHNPRTAGLVRLRNLLGRVEAHDARVAEAGNACRESRLGTESADVGRQRKNPCP
jgi:hypothetical protein